jgi:hypothetical protein
LNSWAMVTLPLAAMVNSGKVTSAQLFYHFLRLLPMRCQISEQRASRAS